MNRTRAIAWNMSILMLGKLVTALLGLATVVLLTRHLGTTGYGYYRTVLAYLSFVTILTHFDLTLIVLRDISQKEGEQQSIIGNALSMRLMVTAGTLVFAAAIAFLFPYNVIVHQGILIGILSYTAVSGHRLLLAVFQQKLLQWPVVLAEVAGATVMFAGIWLLAHLNAGVLAAVGTLVTGDVVTFGLSWLLARRLVAFRLQFNWQEWRRLAVMVLPLAGAEILSLIHYRADALLLSLLQPAADVGFYGIAYKLFETLSQTPFIFAGLMMPFLTQHALRDDEQFHRYLSAAIDVLILSAIGVVAVMLTFAQEIVIIAGGRDFLPAASAMRVLSLTFAILSLSTICKYAVTALDRQQVMLWGQGAAAVVGLTAYLLLIPSYSYVGAAWGTVLAQGTVGLFAGTIIVRSMGKVPSLLTFVKALVAGGITLGIFHMLKDAGISWFLNLCLGSLAYLIILLLLRAIPKDILVALVPRSASKA